MGLTKPKIVDGGGVVLPELTNPAGAENIDAGFEALDGNGVLVTGTSEKKDTDYFTEIYSMAASAEIAYFTLDRITMLGLNYVYSVSQSSSRLCHFVGKKAQHVTSFGVGGSYAYNEMTFDNGALDIGIRPLTQANIIAINDPNASSLF